MSSTPASKRRRIEDASRTLSKPFKSPLKTPGATGSKTQKLSTIDETEKVAGDDEGHGHESVVNEAKSASRAEGRRPPISTNTPTRFHNPSHNRTSSTLPTGTAAAKIPLKASQSRSSPLRSHPLLTGSKAEQPSSSPKRTQDPQMSALRQRQSERSAELSALESETDTLARALAIHTTGSDRDLEALIDKWKGVSRAAAEELFVGVRARVEGMGGVRGWREMEARKRDPFGDNGRGGGGGGWGFDDTGGGGGAGNKEAELEKERLRAEYDVDPEGCERVDAAAVAKDEAEDGETFTMDMMLRSLNVDLHVIGYGKQEQRWID
ncbi:MAG: hypothetical protein M1819_000717 [Sarea resinae]|nr:MAG: hypothetical protein M1819_000717 [Sarea resinae]